MSKVKVNKEVFDAIEFYTRKGGNWEEEVLKDVTRSKESLSSHTSAIILSNNFSLMELAKLLINGYEVVCSPLEELEYTYQDINRNYKLHVKNKDRANMDYYDGYLKGMEKVSEILSLDVIF